MAYATYTATLKMPPRSFGDKLVSIVKYAITTWAADGIQIVASEVGFGTVDAVLGITLDSNCDQSGGPVSGMHDVTNGAIQLYSATDTLVSPGAMTMTIYVTYLGS